MINTFKLKSHFFSRDITLSFLESNLEVVYPSNKYVIEYADIDKFRCGIKWISGYMFTIGRIYIIEFLRKDGSHFTFILPVLYKKGIEKKQQTYNQIITQFFDHIFDERINMYIEQINSGDILTIEKIKLELSGIHLNDNKISRWNNVGLKKYTNYYMIYELTNPNVHKSFSYVHDWNSWIIYYVCNSYIANDSKT